MSDALTVGLAVALATVVMGVFSGILGYFLRRNIEQVDTNLEVVAGVARQLEIDSADREARIKGLEAHLSTLERARDGFVRQLADHVSDDQRRLSTLEAEVFGGHWPTGGKRSREGQG